MNEEQNINEEEETKNSLQTDSSPASEKMYINTSENTTSDISQPENMEVHHHPDTHHNKKKWKEYFLEFLMIFLAVTMGFFAEQIRETSRGKRKAS